MPMNTKLLLGGAAALALLLSSKSSSSKKSSGTTNTDKKPDDGKGDEGEIPGPNGCAVGLIVKDGVCTIDPKGPNDPKNPDNNTNTEKNKYNGLPSAESMSISADCKTVKFGDTTGDAWWKIKGKPKAQQWVKNGYENPLMISYEMIHGLSPCFAKFPIQKSFTSRKDMELSRIAWIKSNRAVWNLLWSVRNRIDKEFFDGQQTVELDLKTLKFKYGAKFDFEKFWEEFLLPLTSTALEQEMDKPGYLFKGVVSHTNDTEDLFSDQYALATQIFIILTVFSNIPMTSFLKLLNPGTDKLQVFGETTTKFNGYLSDHIVDLLDDGVLIGFEAETA